MSNRITVLLVTGSCLAMTTAVSARAQTTPDQATSAADGDADQQGGDIIVTARRVSESQQNVPMSLTEVTGAELRERDVNTVTDLQKLVPSLTVNTGLSRNNTSFAIRGQRGGSMTAGLGGGPSVVPYFAEAPVYASGPGLFFDLQNVQVLNGPQGTLFGQNTTGGAILFEPARPTNKVEGYMMGTYGSYSRLDVEGVVNIPIIADKLLFRGGIQRQTRDGFTHDVVSKRDYDNRDSTVYRASLTARPFDWLENYTVGSLYVSNEQGPGVVLLAANTSNPALLLGPAIGAALNTRRALGLDVRHVILDAQTRDRVRTSSIVNRTTIDLAGNLKLTNIVSYGRYQTDSARDDDGTPLPIQNSNGSYIPGSWNVDILQFTEELRLTGDFGPLNIQTGGYYDRTSPGGINSYTQELQTVATTNQTNAELRGKSRALFGQVGFDMGKITPALRGLNLTAGYRYTWNDFAVGIDLLVYPGVISFPPPTPKPGDLCQLPFGAVYPNCHLSAAGSTSGDSFAFGADYKVTDKVLVFANYKKGYKPGGINPILIGLGGTVNSIGFLFKPETVKTTEVGIKTEWAAGGVRGHFNATGYINKYNDIQANVPLLIGALTTGGTGNAAKATIQGVELEGDVRFGRLFAINAGYAYTDAHYDRYVLPTTPPTDLTSLPFVYTPKNQFNVSANLTLPLPESVGEIKLSGNYAWKGRTYVGDTDPTQPFSYIDAYGLLGARIDWNNVLDNGHVDLSFFATNLTNKTYRTNVIQQYNATGYSTAIFGEPRMYGMSLRARF
ncbi:MAG: TonB-dependent receptor [Sphingomonas sp.]|uniref:TonB-dependent receptor n=1 Tax=Sphingomonas sp. TaxID=28214 RepID=UPI001ACAD7D0|nr:TonB-dependent receptor [Sphingomonas sp.]MBN8807100.1 TonB-dependent receptor [Sphingomonas sp.]